MKKSIKTLLSISLIFVLMLSVIQVPKQAKAAEGLEINADAAIIIEASTGKILYAKNENAALGIASMTKMMTEYLMFEAIQDKKITWDQTHVISEKIHQVSIDTALSNIPLEQGAEYTIRELYEAMAIYSANGATMAIAEAIAGSEGAFVKLMNEKAKELGLENYEFVNSSGLNNESLRGNHPEGTKADAENIMSAKSTARLAMLIMEDFPEVLETASIPRKKFRELDGEMKNWNLMLPSLEFEYPGVDGLKTGTTDFAGRSFTGTAVRGDFRVITVVMNAKDANGNSNDTGRFGETRKMLDYAFGNFEMKEIFPANYEIKDLSKVDVIKGKEDSVKVKTDKPIKMVVKNGEDKKAEHEYQLNKKLINKDQQLTAPVDKDTKIGTLSVKVEKGDLGYVSAELEPKTNIITTEKVEKAGWFSLAMRSTGGFFADLWKGTVKTVKGWF